MYKEVIEASTDEPWKDLYKNQANEELNRDMLLKLKLASLTQLRKEDA
jgi:hypothetical protein